MELLSDHEEPLELKINEKYATKFEEKKRLEDLKKAKDLGISDSDSSEYSTEDEDGDLLTNHVGDKIIDTIYKIRTNDPSLRSDKKIWKSADFDPKKSSEPAPAEQRRMDLQEFKEAAEEMSDEEFLSVKPKTADEQAKDDEEQKSFEKKNLKKLKGGKTEDVISELYGENELNAEDAFLKDFLLNERWKDNNPLQKKSAVEDAAIDEEEEEEQLWENDDFEREHNFRFEEEGGTQIRSHARKIAGSVRQLDDKRKKARQRAKEAKEAEKSRRLEEIKRLKNIKKAEIAKRLKAISDITGNTELAFDKVDLEEEWNPEEHDKQMEEMLGDDYEEKEENLEAEDLLKNPEGEIFGDAFAPEAEDEGEWAEEANEEWAEETGGWEEDGQDHPDWYLCDGCYKGILGGQKRFDCTTCKDFTLCTKCFRTVGHKHRMLKKSTPKWCMPPEEYKGKHFIPDKEPKKLDEYMEENFDMDYEDIIGGDLPTRFKYAKVPERKYGMTPEFVLQKSDTELHEMLPLKAIAPFRDESEVYEDPRSGLKYRYGKLVKEWHKDGKTGYRVSKRKKPDGIAKEKPGTEEKSEETEKPEEDLLDAVKKDKKKKKET